MTEESTESHLLVVKLPGFSGSRYTKEVVVPKENQLFVRPRVYVFQCDPLLDIHHFNQNHKLNFDVNIKKRREDTTLLTFHKP